MPRKPCVVCGLIAVVAALTGCGNSLAPTTTTVAARAQDSAPYLAGVREFHWGAAELGLNALRFNFFFPQDTQCEFRTAHSGVFTDSGYAFVAIYQREDAGYFFSELQANDLLVVRSGPADSGGETGPGTRYSSTDTISSSGFVGRQTYTLITKGHQAFLDSESPGFGFALSLSCQASFDVLNAQVGEEARLYSFSDVEGTAVSATAFGSVVNTEGSAALSAADSGLYVSTVSGQGEASRIQVTHPAGTEDVTGFGTSLLYLPSGPGLYEFNVTRVGALPDSFWVGSYGLERILDLGSGLLSESAILRQPE